MKKTLTERMKAKIRRLSRTERSELASALRDKAERILANEYDGDDEPGDNCLWAGDLLRAAGLIVRLNSKTTAVRAELYSRLNNSEAEEIEAILG